jgi:hypothetical protein
MLSRWRRSLRVHRSHCFVQPRDRQRRCGRRACDRSRRPGSCAPPSCGGGQRAPPPVMLGAGPDPCSFTARGVHSPREITSAGEPQHERGVGLNCFNAIVLDGLPVSLVFHFPPLHLQQISFSASPASRSRGIASPPAHSTPRSPASAAAATPRRGHPSPSADDFSFRVLVPGQAASHFNFLSQVVRIYLRAFPPHLRAFPPSTLRPDSFSSYQRSRNLTINVEHSQLASVGLRLY